MTLEEIQKQVNILIELAYDLGKMEQLKKDGKEFIELLGEDKKND